MLNVRSNSLTNQRATANVRRQRVVDFAVTQGGRIAPQSVIDPRLDVGAQQAILRLARGTPRQRIDALGLLSAVKAGRLQGIFGDDLQAAAQQAARRGTVRWQLVPPGQDAVLVRSPVMSQPPTIIFREQARSVPARLDPALQRAFGVFRRKVGRGAILQVASAGENPWLCSFLCAFCAALIADGIPFDEVPLCALCLKCIVSSS